MISDLKLVALDHNDLKVISAHLQDAVFKAKDVVFLPHEKRFVVIINRFNWAASFDDRLNSNVTNTRHRTAFRIERVLWAQTQNLNFQKEEQVLSLLTIQYEQLHEDDPAGLVTLILAGNGAIRLKVEYIEMEVRDLGGIWAASSKPEHKLDS